MSLHIPVMLGEVLNALRPFDSQSVVVDATLGLGGHTKAILKNCENAFVIGFDQDPNARKIAENNLAEYRGRFEIVSDNFRNIAKLLDRDDWSGASAVLFDLGVSNLQLTDASRGFSFQNEGPLDMRMDNGDFCSKSISARDIIEEYSISELTEIFRNYGEERYAYQIARGIVRNREHGGKIETTTELASLIREILPAPVQRKMGGHPARKIFQALRIAVNDEMGALNEALDGALNVLLERGGKLIVISYHSLEDRMVKHRFRKWQEEMRGMPNPRKALVPTDAEVEENYKSRSAKLRVFECSNNEGGASVAL